MRILEGGDGSGNFGHEGRPGEVGGSTSKDISWVIEKATEQWISANPEQRDSLQYYTGPGYIPINARLRRDYPWKNPKGEVRHQNNIKQLDSLFSELDEDMIVYRGVGKFSFDYLGKNEYTDKGYVSTTVSKQMSWNFPTSTGSTEGKGGTVKIPLKKGQKVLYGNTTEGEIILPRNTHFKPKGLDDKGQLEVEIVS